MAPIFSFPSCNMHKKKKSKKRSGAPAPAGDTGMSSGDSKLGQKGKKVSTDRRRSFAFPERIPSEKNFKRPQERFRDSNDFIFHFKIHKCNMYSIGSIRNNQQINRIFRKIVL